ncbi:MAG TPA: CvpA family protein [Aggregatilineales bacterium]|nr:CvpA family protein [Anaerolineales bacterium]HRE49411.1 CvpA family protein [Aggregatilineales bacterium]
MVQLSTIFWTLIVLWGVIGFLRGYTRELVSAAGIILALFATWQFDGVVLRPLLRGATAQQQFWVYSGILSGITFFAYQTPAVAARIAARQQASGRVGLQERLLGLFFGALNGYLFFGSIWYYLDVFQYPFPPFIYAPSPESASAALVASLPLLWLVQNNLLTILVIVLFMFVLIAMI